MPIRDYPSPDLLKQLFDYHEDGKLFWKKEPRPRDQFPSLRSWAAWNAKCPGKLAGYLNIQRSKETKDKYRWLITINGQDYYRSVLIWGMLKGEYPPKGIKVDHENMNSQDDRIENLRLSNDVQSTGNRSTLFRNNTSGYKGVFFDKKTKLWRVILVYNKIRYELGYYATPEEGSLVYIAKNVELLGEYSPYYKEWNNLQ